MDVHNRADRVEEIKSSLTRANMLVGRGQERIARTYDRIRESMMTLLICNALYATRHGNSPVGESKNRH